MLSQTFSKLSHYYQLFRCFLIIVILNKYLYFFIFSSAYQKLRYFYICFYPPKYFQCHRIQPLALLPYMLTDFMPLTALLSILFNFLMNNFASMFLAQEIILFLILFCFWGTWSLLILLLSVNNTALGNYYRCWTRGLQLNVHLSAFTNWVGTSLFLYRL